MKAFFSLFVPSISGGMGINMKKTIFAFQTEISSEEIKRIRNKLALTQAGFAQLVNVSQKTVERWESEKKPVTGPIVTLIKILSEYPQLCNEYKVPEKTEPMRLWYMYKNEVCTIIDVNEREKRVQIYNYTHDNIFRAFGANEKPTFEDYQDFLESRCFPRTRDKMKLILKELDLPFYEPLMIIEKTAGKMAEDEFWIRIER